MANEEPLSQDELENVTTEAPEGLENAGLDADLPSSDDPTQGALTSEEQVALQELSMLSMQAAASALAGMLNKEVQLADVHIQLHTGISDLPEPFAGEDKNIALVQYSQAYSGSALLLFKTDEARTIANLTLGQVEEEASGPLSEMQLNGLGEALNLMVNGAATQLTSLIAQPVEVDPLTISPYTADSLMIMLPGLASGAMVEMTFPFLIGEESAPLQMTQLMSALDAKALVQYQLKGSAERVGTDMEPSLVGVGIGISDGETQRQANPVTVQPIQFAALDNQPNPFGEQNKNLELVMDVALNLTVELGKTEISIKEVLELTRGSVIELDRVAGEPVDLLANGKLIAKGEVVVIEDNFGLRITSIVSPADRLRGL